MSIKSANLCLLTVIAACIYLTACNQPQKAVTPTQAIKKSVPDVAPVTDTLQFRKESLKDEFKNFKIYPLTDTIKIDLNGDGAIDRAYFAASYNGRKLIVRDGLTGKQEIVGNDKSFMGMAKTLDWVDFWGTTTDKETNEVIVKNDEIVGGRTTKLNSVSLFVRKDEVGGGVITFKKGKYIWVHQSN